MLTHERLHYAGATEQAGATLVHDAAAVSILAPDPLERPAVPWRKRHAFMRPRCYNSTLETQQPRGKAGRALDEDGVGYVALELACQAAAFNAQNQYRVVQVLLSPWPSTWALMLGVVKYLPIVTGL
jgi:hypothetical protein